METIWLEDFLALVVSKIVGHFVDQMLVDKGGIDSALHRRYRRFVEDETPQFGYATYRRLKRANAAIGMPEKIDGPVVPREMLGRLTARFERANADALGSGLGLAIAEICARKLGGHLTLARRTPAGLRAELQLIGHGGGAGVSGLDGGSTGRRGGDAVG